MPQAGLPPMALTPADSTALRAGFSSRSLAMGEPPYGDWMVTSARTLLLELRVQRQRRRRVQPALAVADEHHLLAARRRLLHRVADDLRVVLNAHVRIDLHAARLAAGRLERVHVLVEVQLLGGRAGEEAAHREVDVVLRVRRQHALARLGRVIQLLERGGGVGSGRLHVLDPAHLVGAAVAREGQVQERVRGLGGKGGVRLVAQIERGRRGRARQRRRRLQRLHVRLHVRLLGVVVVHGGRSGAIQLVHGKARRTAEVGEGRDVSILSDGRFSSCEA